MVATLQSRCLASSPEIFCAPVTPSCRLSRPATSRQARTGHTATLAQSPVGAGLLQSWWNDAEAGPDQVQGLEKLRDTLESDVPLPIEESDADSRDFALALVRVAIDTKALQPLVLHVAPLVSWTSYLVICTVQSRPQLGAILTKAEQMAEADYSRRPSGPRATRSPWEVLDFGDVILHLFTPDERQFYDLEAFYSGAAEVDIQRLLQLATPPSSTQGWSIKQSL